MARVCMVVLNNYVNDPRVRREAEALVERGDTVDCICLQIGAEKAANLHGVRLFSISARKYHGARLLGHLASCIVFFCFAFLKVSVLHLRNPYDIVQVATMPDFLVFAALVPKLLGAKVILDVHDLMPEVYMAKFGGNYQTWIVRLIVWIERRSVAFADRAIAVHQPHLDILVRHGNPASKFSVLLNVPDHRIFVRNAFSPQPKGFRLIYHGSVPKRAGLDVALRAVARVRKHIPDIEFLIVGDGEDITRLRGLTQELNLTDCVEFNLGVPVEQLPALLLQATVGVIPYVEDAFTRYVLPTKLLEYAALRIPVVVSRLHTIEAHFDDDMVRYCQPGSEIDLAEQIMELYYNPATAAALAENAASFAREYDWREHRQIYFGLIDSLLPEAHLVKAS
jgi:glycosyltransferase involved in cell wall biosynthesis